MDQNAAIPLFSNRMNCEPEYSTNTDSMPQRLLSTVNNVYTSVLQTALVPILCDTTQPTEAFQPLRLAPSSVVQSIPLGHDSPIRGPARDPHYREAKSQLHVWWWCCWQQKRPIVRQKLIDRGLARTFSDAPGTYVKAACLANQRHYRGTPPTRGAPLTWQVCTLSVPCIYDFRTMYIEHTTIRVRLMRAASLVLVWL